MIKNKKSLIKKLRLSAVFWPALCAALLYCSWPLGLILNPITTHHSLASQLEAPHQPYNWLFIAMDVGCGLLLAGIGIFQLRRGSHTRFLRMCIASYIIFGLLAAVAALVPLDCDPSTMVCGTVLHNPSFLLHGFCSIASVLFLLLDIILLAKWARSHQVSWVMQAVFAIILLGWAVFGLGSLLEIVDHIKNNILQDYFITLCSISIIMTVASVEYYKYLQRHKKSLSSF